MISRSFILSEQSESKDLGREQRRMKKPEKTMTGKQNSKMSIVIVGHVDHGKSTVLGRLLADTKSLPKGKLEQVRLYCQKNAKPFEHAFLLDALKDEQEQGITIDSARCFCKSKKRGYIIIDAPGHIEFVKNMISGAARADAALLVIDANEGIRENSKRCSCPVNPLPANNSPLYSLVQSSGSLGIPQALKLK